MRKTKYTIMIALALVFLLGLSGLAYSQKGDRNKGRRLYDSYCVPCHGETGKGDGTRGAIERFDPMPRNHTNGEYMNKRPDDELFDVIKHSGKSRNFSHIMPAWKTILTDDEIYDVLSYVRSLALPPYQPGAATEKKGR